MCFGYFCDECAYKTRGSRFCSPACGDYFMHGDEEDQQEAMVDD